MFRKQIKPTMHNKNYMGTFFVVRRLHMSPLIQKYVFRKQTTIELKLN